MSGALPDKPLRTVACGHRNPQLDASFVCHAVKKGSINSSRPTQCTWHREQLATSSDEHCTCLASHDKHSAHHALGKAFFAASAAAGVRARPARMRANVRMSGASPTCVLHVQNVI
jgi:hypothetical protein